jgi:serine/threonine protein kinase
MPPRSIGQYEIVSVLGSGGIGCVYRAFDHRSGDEVALKLLSSGPALDAAAARRMAREFEALADLSHPNVVRVFDTGVYRGYPYLTMELVDGLTLREYLSVDHGGLPEALSVRRQAAAAAGAGTFDDASADSEVDVLVLPFDLARLAEEPESDLGAFAGEHVSGRGPEALRRLADAIDEPFTEDEELASSASAGPEGEPEPTQSWQPDLKELNRPERVALLKDAMQQICEALAYVHARGRVHRDLKPSNIMVDEDRRVKLMDFGLAKFVSEDSNVTDVGKVVGTYRYMAPEQVQGWPVDARADLYSLGVMLYELLAGRPPFDAATPVEMYRQILDREAPALLGFNARADVQLAQIAHRLMRKDPDNRYQTAEEVLEALVE